MSKYLHRFAKPAAVLAAVAVLGACAADIRNHGYSPPQEDLARINVGVDTRGSVRRKIGRPGSTGIFNEQGWYYVSSQVEHYLYNDPRVIERKVVAVLFNENDVVAAVNTYGMEDGRIVDLETNTTPTYGRQLTILEQAFGNIGVSAEDIFGN